MKNTRGRFAFIFNDLEAKKPDCALRGFPPQSMNTVAVFTRNHEQLLRATDDIIGLV